jgi:phosphoribosylglycinamide formyltransferase-1
MTLKLGVLGSTRGTNLEPILAAIACGELDAQVMVVISNKVDAPILQRAQHHSIPCHTLDTKGKDRQTVDREVHAVLQQYQVDMVLMIGYMRIVSPWLCRQWPNKMLNVHPSLLPRHAGLMDLAVHQSVLDAGEHESGCTVHYLTAQVDAGAAVVQKRCLVHPDDTAQTLKTRVQQLEGLAWVKAIAQFTH